MSRRARAGRAAVPGYLVGGKTGTAEKVENGRYSADKRLNSFLAAFPMDDPQYVVLVVLDEPKPEKQGGGRHRRRSTPRRRSAPSSAASAALLGVEPRSSTGTALPSWCRTEALAAGLAVKRTTEAADDMLLGDLAAADLTLPDGAGAIDDRGPRRRQPRGRAAASCSPRCPGSTTDGARFVADAVGRGAVAVLAGDGRRASMPAPASPVIRADDPRRALALMAARFHPRQPEQLVAVTGTSGKTSVAAFARQIFAAAGDEAASIGTIGVVSRRWSAYGSLTTPDPVALHAALDRLAGEGVTHAALEASSHGLDQRRLDGVRIAAAGFTNLGRDHMDYHPTVEDYLAAKLRLFTAILPHGRRRRSSTWTATMPPTWSAAAATARARR